MGRKEHPAGGVFWAFISLYGLFRFIVEFFREPDSQVGFILGGFSMGQMLSLPMFLLGGGMVVWLYWRERSHKL
jgi:phosphatidylglycerol:prolipoprotein diacylglycerol transferase